MKPVEGRYQAVMRKREGYKPRNCRVGKADGFSMFGRQYGVMRYGSAWCRFPGVSAHGMVSKGVRRNLGDPGRFPHGGYPLTSRKEQGGGDACQEVGQPHSTRSMGKPCTGGRGLRGCVEERGYIALTQSRRFKRWKRN